MTLAYREPTTLDELFALLETHGPAAVLLAGGTDLFPLHRSGPTDLIVGLRRLVELRGVRVDPTGVWIGAMTNHRAVERSEIVRAHLPALAEAAGTIGSVRIRNQGTLGGNVTGANPAWDLPPILVALDAVAVVAGPGGRRREPLVSLLALARRPTVPHPEVLLGVNVPVPPPRTRAIHVKARARSSAGGPVATVAAAGRLDATGRVEHLRLALGALGATVVVADGAEAALRGRRPTPELIRHAAAAAVAETDPVDDTRAGAAYKRAVARVWVQRALARVTS